MSGDILAIVPAGLACILQVWQAYVYKERDYKQDITDLEKANKEAEAATLEALLESQIATESYEAGDEGLRDKYLEYIYKIHKHTRLDIELGGYRNKYVRVNGVAVAVFYLALVCGIGFAVALLVWSSLPLLIVIIVGCVNGLLLATIIFCTFTLRHYISKLDTIKQRGDLIL